MSSNNTVELFPEDDYGYEAGEDYGYDATAEAAIPARAQTTVRPLALVPDTDDEDTVLVLPEPAVYDSLPFPERVSRAAQQPLTDMGLGARLFIHLQDKVAWVTTSDGGGDWRVYNGQYWVMDRGSVEVDHLTRSVILSIVNEEAQFAATNDTNVKAAEHELRLMTGSGVAGPALDKAKEKVRIMRAMAESRHITFGERCQDGMTHIKSATAAAKRLLTLSYHIFDAHPTKLNVKNGTVDLRTGELAEHKATDYFSRMANTDYKPGATHKDLDTILAGLDNQDPELRHFMQRYLGLSCTGLNAKRFVYASGESDAGKTTQAAAVAAVLSNPDGNGYSRIISPSVLTLSKYESGEGATDNLHSLMGIRFVLCDEAEAGFFNLEKVKKLTSGGEMTTRMSYGKPMTWRSEAKLYFAGNGRMAMPDNDAGMAKRLIGTHLPNAIPAHLMDTDLEDRMREAPQQEALLAWIIEGAAMVLAEGCNADALHITEKQREETAFYLNMSDMLADFFEDNVREVPEGEDYLPLTTGQWHGMYTQYCNAHKATVLSSRQFGDRLSKKGFQASTDRTVKFGGLENKGRMRMGIASTLDSETLALRVPGIKRTGANAAY